MSETKYPSGEQVRAWRDEAIALEFSQFLLAQHIARKAVDWSREQTARECAAICEDHASTKAELEKRRFEPHAELDAYDSAASECAAAIRITFNIQEKSND